MGYKDISSVDISAHSHIGFWIRSSTNLSANALEVVVSESNHASGEKTGTYVECLSTALTADAWTFVCLEKTLTDFIEGKYKNTLLESIYTNFIEKNPKYPGTNDNMSDMIKFDTRLIKYGDESGIFFTKKYVDMYNSKNKDKLKKYEVPMLRFSSVYRVLAKPAKDQNPKKPGN